MFYTQHSGHSIRKDEVRLVMKCVLLFPNELDLDSCFLKYIPRAKKKYLHKL